MKKNLFAFTLVGMLSASAFAQGSPPGVAVPPNTPGIASDKAQRAGEARKEMRPTTGVRPSSGDTNRVPEGGAVGTDKAAVAGEARAETRDTRRPGKPRTTQGGTPQ